MNLYMYYICGLKSTGGNLKPVMMAILKGRLQIIFHFFL